MIIDKPLIKQVEDNIRSAKGMRYFHNNVQIIIIN